MQWSSLFEPFRRFLTPKQDGVLKVPGMTSPVEIIRDRFGIPHIYAQRKEDLFFAQGFVHAQDRLWQMELARRTACGTLSAYFGSLTLSADRMARTLGFLRSATEEWPNMKPTAKKVIERYTEGVNAFLTHGGGFRGLEFLFLGLNPQPFKEVEVLAMTRLMAWQLTHSWYDSLIRARFTERVGEEAAREWEIHPLENAPSTLAQGVEIRTLPALEPFPKAPPPFLERGQGSNSWVLSGAKTETGQPILANDVHLSIRLPSVWYENHLVCSDLEVTGASAPGIPLVLIGHNRDIAWGVTVSYVDCEDIFVEKFHPDRPLHYEFEGTWREASRFEEMIFVKDDSPFLEEVIVTHHGPLISKALVSSDVPLALSSVALRENTGVEGWLRLNQATGWDDFQAAMREIPCPHLNVTYADRAGNSGYFLSGRVPVRKTEKSLFPACGWSGIQEWIGEIPFAEMPRALNPQKGYILTCNHRIVSDDYPHALGRVFANGFRAKRADDLIQKKDKLSLRDCCDMQMDVTSVAALLFQKAAADIETHPIFRSWDGSLAVDSVGASMYEVFRYRCIRSLLEPVVGREMANQMTGQGFHAALAVKNEFYGHDTLSLLRILDNPHSFWLKKAGGRKALLERSFQEAMGWLTEHLGADIRLWKWGRLHRVTFAHALGKNKIAHLLFDCGSYPIGGDQDTLCQTATLVESPYENRSFTPTYRQVIDLGDFSRSVSMHAPGQSGHRASRHYQDMLEPWRKGEFHPMLWIRSEIEAQAESRLRLEPILLCRNPAISEGGPQGASDP